MKMKSPIKKIGLRFYIAYMLLRAPFSLSAQIQGTVTDLENGEVLISATIFNRNNSDATTSDIQGEFQINAVPGDVLEISYLGYETAEIIIGNQSKIEVKLVRGIILDEVVVTGYTVDPRRKIVGSVSSVETRDLQIAPSGNVEQQLQGRVPGLTVITNGQPGTTSQVRVRGYGALGGNEPLYIVDGVPLNSLDFLAPDDIESVTVLKDASAASVYGARAAGGVIVYTTKKGSDDRGSFNVTYDGLIGISNPGKGISVMDPQTQAEWTWKAIENAAIQNGTMPVFNHPQYGNGERPILPDYLLIGNQAGVIGDINLNDYIDQYNIDLTAGPVFQIVKANKQGTDWYDAVTRNGLIHRHHLGISGAGNNNHYYVGLGMQTQEGIIKHQEMTRYSMRINTQFELTRAFRIGENLQCTYISTQLLEGENGGIGSADNFSFVNSYLMSPLIPIYDEFGGYAGTAAPGFGSLWSNPVAVAENLKDNRNFSAHLFGNLYAEWEPIDQMILRSSFGGQYRTNHRRNYLKTSYWGFANRNVAGYEQFTGFSAQWVFTNTLSYQKDIGYHHLNLLIGHEAIDEGGGYTINGTGQDPLIQDVNYITLSTTQNRTVNGDHIRGARFNSYFSRINYDFNDKYFISGILRRDGSSRFGILDRYGYFPALSLAWRLSSENFFSDLDFIEDLKLRAGYGIMGNSNNVDPNNQYTLYTTSLAASSYDINGTNISAVDGFYRNRIGNPSARWEKAITSNIGIDMLLMDGKIDLGLEWWKKRTKDLLFQVPLIAPNGFFAAEPFVNVGEIMNQGFDFMISYKKSRGKIKGSLTVNGSFLKNEISALAPGIDNLPDRSLTYGNITPVLNQVGSPLSSFYGYEVQGIFKDWEEVANSATQLAAAPGRFRFRDLNGDASITSEDRTILGNPIPDFTGGLSLNVRYNRFELETYAFVCLGNEIFNLARLRSDFYGEGGTAISQRIKDSWSFENPHGTIPLFETNANFSNSAQASSYFVEDGSYFRLQNITLSYLPDILINNWSLQNLRVYLSVNNLFTITSYSGLDPGVGGISDTNFGIDQGNYPIVRNWIFGINVTF